MAVCPVCLARLPVARTLTPFFNARAKVICPTCSTPLKRAGRMVLYHASIASGAAVMGAAMALSNAPLSIAATMLTIWLVIAALWFVVAVRFAVCK